VLFTFKYVGKTCRISLPRSKIFFSTSYQQKEQCSQRSDSTGMYSTREGLKLWSVHPFRDPCNASEVVISRMDEPGPFTTPATHAPSIASTRRRVSHFLNSISTGLNLRGRQICISLFALNRFVTVADDNIRWVAAEAKVHQISCRRRSSMGAFELPMNWSNRYSPIWALEP
jgi:hypothetical protein